MIENVNYFIKTLISSCKDLLITILPISIDSEGKKSLTIQSIWEIIVETAPISWILLVIGSIRLLPRIIKWISRFFK